MYPPKVVNIVAIGKLKGVDFGAVKGKSAAQAQSMVKGSRRFNGVVIKLPSICTVLLFPNGSITVVGLKSFDIIGEVIASTL